MNDYIDTEKDCEEGEKRFRRFLLITVVAIGCLLLIILLLFADRYNWLDFLAIPLKDMARFVRRNLSYIVIGFFCAAALLLYLLATLQVRNMQTKNVQTLNAMCLGVSLYPLMILFTTGIRSHQITKRMHCMTFLNTVTSTSIYRVYTSLRNVMMRHKVLFQFS